MLGRKKFISLLCNRVWENPIGKKNILNWKMEKHWNKRWINSIFWIYAAKIVNAISSISVWQQCLLLSGGALIHRTWITRPQMRLIIEHHWNTQNTKKHTTSKKGFKESFLIVFAATTQNYSTFYFLKSEQIMKLQ